ncbi:MAG: glycosyltransferase family 4 protein [Patescibacteria group bacterium]
MHVLALSADRSNRGVLCGGSSAFKRQEAYAKQFGNLDIIVFSLMSDGSENIDAGPLRIFPTNSWFKILWGIDAFRIVNKLPRPDIVTVQDPFETGLAGLLIAQRLGVPLHVQVHTDFLSPEYAKLSLLNRMRVCVAGFVLRRAARVRVVSERVGSSIKRKYDIAAPVTVLPIFVDIAKFRDAKMPAKPFTAKKYSYQVLIVARSAAEKNIKFAEDAFEKSAPPDARLIVCGDISEEDIRNKQSDRIYYVSTDDPASLYKAVDLVLVPSKYEGYGLVIVEALAAGKPVLSTDVGIAREAGAIITTEEKFADALSEWFKNGPRTGELKNYPYKNLDGYIQAYCDDILAVAG